MKKLTNKLIIEHLDNKLHKFQGLKEISIPDKGWITAIRSALNMSLRQFSNRLGINPSSAKHLETREVSGSVTIKKMKEAADALNMAFIYALVPKDESIEKMIEKRANKIAREIIYSTDSSMKLEDQGVSNVRLMKDIQNKVEDIIREMPRYLWD